MKLFLKYDVKAGFGSFWRKERMRKRSVWVRACSGACGACVHVCANLGAGVPSKVHGWVRACAFVYTCFEGYFLCVCADACKSICVCVHACVDINNFYNVCDRPYDERWPHKRTRTRTCVSVRKRTHTWTLARTRARRMNSPTYLRSHTHMPHKCKKTFKACIHEPHARTQKHTHYVPLQRSERVKIWQLCVTALLRLGLT